MLAAGGGWLRRSPTVRVCIPSEQSDGSQNRIPMPVIALTPGKKGTGPAIRAMGTILLLRSTSDCGNETIRLVTLSRMNVESRPA